MPETFFEEIKRYVGFGETDQAALRAFASQAAPHFPRITEEFYARLSQHPRAKEVFSGPDQVERLKKTLVEWMDLLLRGPWDEAYFERRAKIGRVHVRISLPQRFMFGAMDLVRVSLLDIALQQPGDADQRLLLVGAVNRIIDIELTIMLETYREAFVDKVQSLEREEKAALTVRTHRAERLAELGTLAAGLAHEIRNPLNAAHLQLNLAQRRMSRPGDLTEARSALDLVGTEMQRLAGLVDDFLQFARPQPLRVARADLRSTAEVTLALVRPEAVAAGVELRLAAGDPTMLKFDHERIKQVLLNLLRNAVEAAGAGGRVNVSLGQKDGAATLIVEDSGPGFPEGAPIFEPFFTTKDRGTGLGLAIVYRIVSDHHGKVDVDSRPGRTVVSVSLPWE